MCTLCLQECDARLKVELDKVEQDESWNTTTYHTDAAGNICTTSHTLTDVCLCARYT